MYEVMKLSEDYIQSKDIDWFCCINGIYVHAASAGGELPNIVNDYNKLRGIQEAVSKLPDIYKDEELIFNETFIKKELENNINLLRNKGIFNGQYDPNKGFEYYIFTFKSMARKGFISYDRTHVNEIDDNHYHWVARPCNDSCIPEIEIPIVEAKIDKQSLLDQELDLIKLLKEAKIVRN